MAETETSVDGVSPFVSQRDEGDKSGRTDTIENPVLGSRITFLERSADTGGEYVLVEIVEAPQALGPPLHIHPNQSETFEVAEGKLNLEVDGEEWTLGAGESTTVPPGQPHRYWNGSDEQIRATMELRPAGNFEIFLETTAGLAAAGKVNAAGVANPLQTAVILQEYWDVLRLVSPPQWIQKPLFAVLAPVGRLLGYRPDYRYAALTGTEPETPE